MKASARRMRWLSLLGIGLLIGCGGVPGTTPTLPTGSSLKGTVTFNGTPKNSLYIGLRQNVGGSWAALPNRSTTTASDGSYGFTSLADGNYQAYYDDQGEIVNTGEVNTAGVFASDPVTVSATQGSTPVSNFDVYWPVNPNPSPGETITIPRTFSWSPNPMVPTSTEYQVLVSEYNNLTNTVGSAVWSSGWNIGNSANWNGKRGASTNNPTGTDAGAGAYVYQVKFRRAGGEYAGGNYYGQTKWIRFTLNR